jgi:outer membrane protein assembly factor BamB
MPKNKTKLLSMIALILTISMVIPYALQPTANAHTPPWTIPSFAYVSVAPSPIGVGQTAQVYMWVDTPMPNAAVTNDIRRHGYQLTIIKPDGITETHNWDVIFDTTGIQFWTYTPDQIGTYTLNFIYAGQTYTWSGTYQNDIMASANATTTLEVTQEQVPTPLGSYPLPNEYWARPIEGQNTDWYSIASNWLNAPYIRSGATVTGGAGYGRYQPDGIGPNSAHVMWSKELQFGGVVGGNDTAIPGETYYMGGSYNVRFSNALVMQGNLYYQEPYGNSGGGGDYVAVDIRTGQELWRINASATGTSIVPSFGYLYSFETGNQHGVLPNGLLIAPVTLRSGSVSMSTWRTYDPRTGVLTSMNVTNVPSGTAQSATLAPSSSSSASVAGPSGELLIYALTNCGTTNNVQMYLTQWNSTNVIGGAGGNGVANWYSGSVDASSKSAYDLNVSVPSLKGGSGWNIYRDAYYNDLLIVTQGSFGTGPRTNGEGVNVTAISIKQGPSFGQVLWSQSYPPAPNNVTRQIIAVDNIARVFITEDKETMQLNGYSLTDGNKVWTADRLVKEWDTVREDTLSAYGKLYCAGFDGILYCYDDKTGDLLWTYGNGGEGNSTYAGLGTSYGHYPIFVDVIADGKIYLGTTEHSPNSPWYKGSEYRCVNATDGTEIWTLMGWGTGMYVGQYDIVADGYFLYLNCYDMKVYSVGKGPSAMTVTASPKVSSYGSSVIIEGTVTDIAAGTKQNEQAARFPNGVPVVSDASMQSWMEYVYMQKPFPKDTTGVEIVLSVVDANGNYREIGRTTTSEGFFSYNWNPDIDGQYTVYANFAGTESYWPSHALTSFAVDPAVPTPTTAIAPLTSVADTYFIPAIAGLFIFVALIGIAIILVLRKRQ